MKILHVVEIYFPDVGGMAEVVQRLSEGITRLGHEVTVATSYSENRQTQKLNGVDIVPFKISGRLADGVHGEQIEIDRFHKLVEDNNFDVVTLFAAQHWATDLCLPRLRTIRAKKIFVPTGFSGFFNPLFANYYDQMRVWIHNFDQVVFLSDDYRDINFARAEHYTKFRIIPNGASREEFSTPQCADFRATHGLPADQSLLLFVGSHYPDKGHRETIQLFKRLKSHNVTLVIAANVPKHALPAAGFSVMKLIKDILKRILALILIKYRRRLFCPHECLQTEAKYNASAEARKKQKSIYIRSFTRQQVVDLYRQSDLFVFPSRIECSPIVVFEAMAAGLPFLATDVGNVTEIISWSGGGLLLPTLKQRDGTSDVKIGEAAALVDAVIGDKALQKRLSSAGHAAWQKLFTWEKIAEDYAGMYAELLKEESTE